MELYKTFAPAKRNSWIYHLLFAAVIVAVVVIKYNDLFLPYFWDELGVYSQAVDYQFQHGLSLMPASVPAGISRGHPLFFVFVNACAWKILGESVFNAHVFCLFTAIVLLSAVYFKVSRFFSPLAGLVSVILLAVQPLFLAQSALVLPEITLSLFIFLGLVQYYEKKFFGFAVFATFALLTKESAIILPVAALFYSLVSFLLLRRMPEGFKIRNLFLTVFPYLVFGVFLLAQKQQNGWYFFPLHMDEVIFDINEINTRFQKVFNFIFWTHARYWWMKCILAGLVIALLRNRLNRHNAGNSFLTLSAIFIFCYFLFSALNFYMERYETVVLVFAAIITAVSIITISRNKILVALAVSLLCVAAYEHWDGNRFNYDADLSYRHAVRSLQQAVDYVSKTEKDNEFVTGNFPANSALGSPEGGYLHGKIPNAWKTLKDNPDYFLKANPGALMGDELSSFNITVLGGFKDGFAEVKVLKLKRK